MRRQELLANGTSRSRWPIEAEKQDTDYVVRTIRLALLALETIGAVLALMPAGVILNWLSRVFPVVWDDQRQELKIR